MLKLKSLIIKNYKSFNEDCKGIKGFNQLNIFIGKKNQGKSNLLEVIELLDYNKIISLLNKIPESTKKLRDYISIQSNREISSLFHHKSSNYLGSHFNNPIEIIYVIDIDNELHTYKVKIESLLFKEKGYFSYIDEKGRYQRSKEPVITFYDGKPQTLNEVLGHPKEIVHSIKFSALDYDYETMKENLLKLSYEEGNEIRNNLLENTQNLSSDFHKIFLAYGDYSFPPNSAGRNIHEVSKQIFDEKWYLNTNLYLDEIGLTSNSLGSGQMQTLALCYEMDMATSTEAPIITIDEMELHLYPSLHKSVLKDINKRSKQHQFFISTHSNILISTPIEQQIFFVKKINESTNVELINFQRGLYDVLDELGVKASDILQTNGIIWVEGPSDIFILKEWLKKIGVSQNDLDQISFIFYGGALINHVKFAKLLDVNRNCVVIQDSDKTNKNASLDNKKILIIKECESLGIHYWTTNVREIENYFTMNAIKKYSKKFKKRKVNFSIIFDEFTDIKEVIPNYEDDKSDNGRIIAAFMTKRDIQKNKELFEELCTIKYNIQKWNKI